jgi:ribosomal protein S19
VQEVRGIVARINENLRKSNKNIRLDIRTLFQFPVVPFLICIRNGRQFESLFIKEDLDLDIDDFKIMLSLSNFCKVYELDNAC